MKAEPVSVHEAMGKLLGYTLEVKRSPNYGNEFVYVIEHHGQTVFVNWGHKSRPTALRFGLKHLNEHITKQLGEQHGI